MNKNFSEYGFDHMFNGLINGENPFFNTGTSYKSRTLKNGDNELIINAVGIDPSVIKINTVDNVLSILSEVKNTNELILNVDLRFQLGTKLNVSKISASIKNGLITIVLPLNAASKSKEIKLEY